MSTQVTTASPGQTPLRNKSASSAPPTPGSWRHPLSKEIARRQRASTFNEHNIQRILYNGAALALLLYCAFSNSTLSSIFRHPSLRPFAFPIILLFSALLLFNLTTALLPLLKPQDSLSDLPLTPTQRALLGLSPQAERKATPNITPGGTYITPPRYPLSTRSVSGSPASAQRSFSAGGLGTPTTSSSRKGSPLALTDRGDSPVHSPLWAKTREVQRRGSRASENGSPVIRRSGSFGGKESGAFGASSGGKSSPYGGGLLNNKWLYERGRGSPGTPGSRGRMGGWDS